jgi:hypothetical protein
MSEQVGVPTSLVSDPIRGASADPVFVLCMGRSGSTLLRFLLDAHPDLACPPETNVPALCGQLANVWALIEGAPLSQNRGDEPPEIPDTVIVGVRETMDRMVGSYLARRGKKRYCDKSLGTARFSYLMSRVWPEAKFICLFRHPMDMMASGMEACPWGLNGYGFEPYIAETPGNSVHALARFWMDNAAAILSAEEQWPQRCYRIRYEDMVSDTQAVADGLYEFLGVDKVPDIDKQIFAADRERFGPADYKIWHTSRISTESMGRGWTLPAGLIGPQIREAINEFCGRLGYLPVDDSWGTADQPEDFRVPIIFPTDEKPGQEPAETQAPAEIRPAIVAASEAQAIEMSPLLIERLREGLTRIDEDFIARWDPCGHDSIMVVSAPDSGHGPTAHWRVDLDARTVAIEMEIDVSGSEEEEEEAAADDSWDIIANVETWQQILSGKLNFSVAMRRHLVRYCDQGDSGPIVADTRIALIADLLGITSWGRGHMQMMAAAANGAE